MDPKTSITLSQILHMPLSNDTHFLKIPSVWQLSEKFHFPKETLRADLEKILARVPFDDKNQINLTALNSNQQDPYLYNGSLYSHDTQSFEKKETDFSYFMDTFRDLIFFQIYQALKNSLPFELGRMRILKLAPRSCYSMHEDDGVRFHIALKTNSHAYLVFKNSGAYHIPADGSVYGSNTMLEHTAMNGGLEERIHLVLSTVWSPDAGETFSRNIDLQTFK